MPTKIEWCDETWNPLTGCSHVSEGCRNCWAERMDRRFQTNHPGLEWLPWTAQNAEQNVTLHSERMGQPLQWKKPRRVFVCSMSDLFHDRVPYSFADDVFSVMAEAKQHEFIILTKRPLRLKRYIDYIIEYQVKSPAEKLDWRWPLPNVILMVSAEDQKTLNERCPLLLATAAAKHGVSLEPLLGPIDFSRVPFSRGFVQIHGGRLPKLDWVIVGGESGPGARPMNPDWVRSIRDQCEAAGVPFFFKQWGEWAPDCLCHSFIPHKTIDRPTPGKMGVMFRCGKKRAGRELDGRTWEEFPPEQK